MLLNVATNFGSITSKILTLIWNYKLSVYPQDVEVFVCGFVAHLDTTDLKLLFKYQCLLECGILKVLVNLYCVLVGSSSESLWCMVSVIDMITQSIIAYWIGIQIDCDENSSIVNTSWQSLY